MSKKDDELNDFVDEVTDGAYNLPCLEVIMKLVNQMQAWGDERIKNIVAAMVLVFVYMSILFTMYCLGYLSRKHTSFKSVLSKYDTFSCLTGGRTVFLCLESPVMPS